MVDSMLTRFGVRVPRTLDSAQP